MDNDEEFEEVNELNNEQDFNSIDGDNIESLNEDMAADPIGSEQLDQSSNESLGSDGSNLKDRLQENKNKGYEKANGGKEAYQKNLDNGKDYYKNKQNDIKNQQNQLNKDKNENKKKRDSAEERLQKAKENHSNQRGFSNKRESRKELKDAKNESKDAKKEEKEQKQKEKQLKKDEKSVNKDSKKADRFKRMHPVEAAKMQVKKKVDKVKKIVMAKIAIIVAPIVLGFILIFFVIELILGPLMEVWGHIDEGITKVADFSEKVTNFYNGFGFQDSKEAFYDEINDLSERYGSELDIPLILSTIFYTEGMGYDTEFGNMESIDSIDDSSTGSNTGIWNAIQEYLSKKYDESIDTTDEHNLSYNVGKIYRLRKLARNQFNTDAFGLVTRKGAERRVSLGDFLDEYGSNISEDIKEMLTDITSLAITSLLLPFNTACEFLTDSKYQGEYFRRLSLITSDFGSTVKVLISDIFYGIADITDIELSVKDGFKIMITYRDFAFDEDNYNNYLMDYYLDHMPEFDEMLPKESEAREERKKQIITEIYENRNLFKEIFLQYADADSESYTESCIGDINNILVSELQLPVTIPEGTTVNFTEGETAFGIRNGRNHNGVDINTVTAGVNEGDTVYAIATGEVVDSLPNVSCNKNEDSSCAYDQGAWVKIKHNMVIDNNEYNFYSIYMHLQANSGQPTIGTRVNKGDPIGKIGNTGNSSGAHLHFEFHNDEDIAVDPTNLFIPCLGTELVGNTNEERIWNYLIGKGYTKIAAAGIMGNWQQESGFLSNNLENGANTKSGLSDEEYTQNVDNGDISRNEFITSEIFSLYSGGRYGYGLAQWTDPSRKTNFYDFWKNYNYSVSIGDLGMQLVFYSTEAAGYSALDSRLNACATPEEAAEIFVNIYEVGTAGEVRKKNAREIYNRYTN